MVLRRVYVHALLNERNKLLQNWTEKSGATETDLLLEASVVCDDVLNTLNLGGLGVCVERKAMINRVDTHVSRDSTESESCKHSVWIVWFKNFSNGPNGGFILVVLTQIVE